LEFEGVVDVGLIVIAHFENPRGLMQEIF